MMFVIPNTMKSKFVQAQGSVEYRKKLEIHLPSTWIRGATSSSFQGGQFHEISFNEVIVIIQPWYNFFPNGHI